MRVLEVDVGRNLEAAGLVGNIGDGAEGGVAKRRIGADDGAVGVAAEDGVVGYVDAIRFQLHIERFVNLERTFDVGVHIGGRRAG